MERRLQTLIQRQISRPCNFFSMSKKLFDTNLAAGHTASSGTPSTGVGSSPSGSGDTSPINVPIYVPVLFFLLVVAVLLFLGRRLLMRLRRSRSGWRGLAVGSETASWPCLSEVERGLPQMPPTRRMTWADLSVSVLFPWRKLSSRAKDAPYVLS